MDKSLFISSLIMLIASIAAYFLKLISPKLLTLSIVFFGTGIYFSLNAFGKMKPFSLNASVSKTRSGLKSLSILIGLICLWLLFDVSQKDLFGSSQLSYLIYYIIFGAGFVFFGVGGCVSLFLENKNTKKFWGHWT